MKKMWVVYAAVVAAAYFVGNTLYQAGSFKSIYPHMEGTIQTVYKEVPGPEDMALDNDHALLFISSTDRWRVLNGKESDDGIFLLRLDEGLAPQKLATTFKGSFHPHGISLLLADSTTYLFAVNHNLEGNFVEIFDYRRDTLFHLRSISDESMCCPNDVVATGSDKFYVTNDHGTQKPFMRTLEDYLRLPLSNLLYYDGKSMRKVYDGVKYGNGVNVSRDGSTLFLAATIDQKLMVFDRDSSSGALSLRSELALKSGLDNIDIDQDGIIWIAAHPKLLAFVGHAKDSSKRSPSQVFSLVPSSDEGGYTVNEVLLDDGSNLSGSSIAVHYKNELFVGGVFERRVLRIQLKDSAQPND